MIRINSNLADEIAQKHYLACKDDVENRILVSISFYQLVIDGKKIIKKRNQSFTSVFNISPSSLVYFRDTYFSPKFRKKSKHQKETLGDLLNSMFFQGNRYMLKITKRVAQEKIGFLNLIKLELVEILKGSPAYLTRYTSESSKTQQNEYKKLIEFIFQYEKLGKKSGEAFGKDRNWNSYSLTEKLKIKVCPYCNKNWINTVVDDNDDKVTNPQLDHFFPQTTFPILRLSFFNLIPSCETCNSRIKGETYLSFDKYIHPYFEEFGPECFFDPIPLDTASSHGVGEDFMLSLEVTEHSDKSIRAKNSFEFFQIENVYDQHGDIISEIYFKKFKYGLTRIEDLLSQDMFKGMSIDEAYRIVFSNYYNEVDFNRRPFSKLAKDTLRSLELL